MTAGPSKTKSAKWLSAGFGVSKFIVAQYFNGYCIDSHVCIRAHILSRIRFINPNDHIES